MRAYLFAVAILYLGARSVSGSQLAISGIDAIDGSLRRHATLSLEHRGACSALRSALSLQGGASLDSNPILFAKVGVGVVSETAAMFGVLVVTKKLAEKLQIFPSIAGLPFIQWVGLFFIIFASSFLGSIVEGGLSVATNQVLDPNVVPGDSEWYSKLAKPSWNPPGWLFPIMWLIVSKPTQMIAVSKILKKGAEMASDLDTLSDIPVPVMALYFLHLSLGDAWNKVFFGMQSIGRGAAIITVFFGLLLSSAYAFYHIEPEAGLYLLPTCGWVLVASALNWSIYLKNK